MVGSARQGATRPQNERRQILSQKCHRMVPIDSHLLSMWTKQAALLTVCMGMAVACSPTVRFEAPDEPIRLEINITIEQEVLIKVDRALDDVFEEQGDIFGLSGES